MIYFSQRIAKYNIKRKMIFSPKSKVMVTFVNPSQPIVCPCIILIPKSSNHLLFNFYNLIHLYIFNLVSCLSPIPKFPCFFPCWELGNAIQGCIPSQNKKLKTFITTHTKNLKVSHVMNKIMFGYIFVYVISSCMFMFLSPIEFIFKFFWL